MMTQLSMAQSAVVNAFAAPCRCSNLCLEVWQLNWWPSESNPTRHTKRRRTPSDAVAQSAGGIDDNVQSSSWESVHSISTAKSS